MGDMDIRQACNGPFVSNLVDDLLAKYEPPKVYTKDPAVDVGRIAKELGIDKIICVPDGELEGKQAFSIAHEIGHIMLGHIDITTKHRVARMGDSSKNALFSQAVTNPEKILNLDQVRELINEAVADFFAASLLVPINRFLLWEDKPDREIAEAFGVEEKCIQKRRSEIERDLPIIISDMVPAE